MAPVLPVDVSQVDYANHSPRVLIEKEMPIQNTNIANNPTSAASAASAATASSTSGNHSIPTFNAHVEEGSNQRYIIIDGVKYIIRS